MDGFLVLRGIKPFACRRHCENGGKVVEFLNNHPKLKQYTTRDYQAIHIMNQKNK
jgi:O-acetylhomoserine/O-acetylserine sulfhydrylase-like pyridoxal-dependent enzyme